MKELGDYHHMDERVLRTHRANLEAPGVQKAYKCIRETFEKAGLKGKMPDAVLLIIASDYHKYLEQFKPKEHSVTPPPRVVISDLVEVVDGGKQSDNDVF